jgi:ferredoxin
MRVVAYVPTVDPEICVAHAECVEIAPEVFRLDETATVIAAGAEDLVMRAAEACPAVAISVVDDETGETIFP